MSNTPTNKLNSANLRVLSERGIPAELAATYGIYDWDGSAVREARKAGRDPFPGLPAHEHSRGLVLEYPTADDRPNYWRVRHERTEFDVEDPAHVGEGSHARIHVELPRYVACKGPVRPFVTHLARKAAGDPSVPIYFVEAPFKAMSLEAQGYAAIGLGGVLAGAHDVAVAHEVKEIVAHRDLRDGFDWRGRPVFSVFDAGASTNPLVALGQAYVWQALAGEGAVVSVVTLPFFHPQDSDPANGKIWRREDQGPDDFLVREGREAFQALIDQARYMDPLMQVRAIMAGGGTARARKAQVTALTSRLDFQACLYLGKARVRESLVALSGMASAVFKEAASDFSDRLVAREEAKESEYCVRDGALHHGAERLASFEAKITEEVRRDDGEGISSLYRLEGALASGARLPTIEVRAEDFGSMEWPHMWGSKAYLEAGKAVKEHARVAIQALSTPTTRRVFSHTGWRDIDGKHVYLLPGGGVGADGYVDAEVELAGRYQRPQLPESKEQALADLQVSLGFLHMAPFEVTAPILAMTFLAPLRPLLPSGLDFTVWVYGPTGSKKSCLAGVAQSHFGDYSYTSLPGSWFSTPNALELAISKSADALYVIDNLIPSKSAKDHVEMTSKVGRLLQTVGDGQARARLDRNAEERAGRTPRAACLSTAEILPPGEGESTYGRIFGVQVRPGTVDVGLLTAYQGEHRSALQRAMGGFLQWLACQDWTRLRSEIAAQVHEQRADIVSLHGGTVHPRLPTSWAKLRIALYVLRRYAGDLARDLEAVDLEDTWLQWGSGLGAALFQQPRVVTGTAADEWLGAVKTILAQGRACLAGQPSEHLHTVQVDGRPVPCIGWRSGEEVWLDPVASWVEVERLLGHSWRYSRSEVQAQLLDASVEVEGHAGPVSILSSFERAGAARRADSKVYAAGGRPRALRVRRIVLGLFEGLRAVKLYDEDPLTDTVGV